MILALVGQRLMYGDDMIIAAGAGFIAKEINFQWATSSLAAFTSMSTRLALHTSEIAPGTRYT